MIYEVMRHCRNYFPIGEAVSGVFTIENGAIDLPFLKEGQYFFIEGSSFSDGVYQYPADSLVDEEFLGYITPLAPPRAFIELVDEIEAWQGKYGSTESENMSPYQSESFNGYSYNKGGNSNGSGGGSVSWKMAFRDRLRIWRKL